MITIVIDEPTPSNNEMIRKYANRFVKKQGRERWHWLVRAAAPGAIGADIEDCNITVTRAGPNPLDWDNMGGGLKFLLDALVSNKIIRDDDPSCIHWLNLEQDKAKRGEGRVTVEIFPVDTTPR